VWEAPKCTPPGFSSVDSARLRGVRSPAVFFQPGLFAEPEVFVRPASSQHPLGSMTISFDSRLRLLPDSALSPLLSHLFESEQQLPRFLCLICLFQVVVHGQRFPFFGCRFFAPGFFSAEVFLPVPPVDSKPRSFILPFLCVFVRC